MRRRAGRAMAASGLLVVVVAACGIGADSQLQTIDQDSLLGLDETTTSTTTTTTPLASAPSMVEPTVAATSTTIATDSVELYFVDGTRLQPVTIDLAGTATPDRVVQALLAGRPLGEIGIGLRTLLPPGLVNPPVVDSGAGYVTVDLATEAFNRIDPADQRTAIAQIVMTLVSRPGIGQVRFTLDGVEQRVPRRDGLQSEPGEGVSRIDYESLLDTVDQPTTTVASATTVAPVATPPPTPPPGP